MDSSDEGLSSDDDLFNKKVQPVITKNDTYKDKGKKGRQSRSGNAERRKTKREAREKDSKDNEKHNSE